MTDQKRTKKECLFHGPTGAGAPSCTPGICYIYPMTDFRIFFQEKQQLVLIATAQKECFSREKASPPLTEKNGVFVSCVFR